MFFARNSIPEPRRSARGWAQNLSIITGLSMMVLGFWTWLAFFSAGASYEDPHAGFTGCPHGEDLSTSFGTQDEDKALYGLWNWVPDLPEGHPPPRADLVRFYYFHEGGIGLYRYGRRGFNNTNSFDWQRKGNELWLKFRKTGTTHKIPFRLQGDGEELAFEDDPRELGNARYRRARGPVDAQLQFWPARAMANLGQALDDEPTLSGHMWIDVKAYETGGMGFSMYQFAPAALDGRGVGWHHRGDFDDWSTETLEYRVEKNGLHLRFDRNQETHRTPFWLERKEHTMLQMHSDPRNWWQRSEFVLMGKSFSAAAKAP